MTDMAEHPPRKKSPLAPPTGFRGKRILYRIVLPFTLLFAVITISSWLISTSLIAHFLDGNLNRQLARVANVISHSSYVLNPAILGQMKEVVHAEIVVFDPRGHLLHHTLDDSAVATGIRGVIHTHADPPASTRKNLIIEGRHYHAVIEPLIIPGHEAAFLSLWMPTDEAKNLRNRIFLATGWLTLFGMIAMTLLGYLIARSITRPVEELAMATGRIAAGDFQHRAIVRHHDEIGMLAQAFNRMLAQIQDYERKLIESEKMGTAGQMAAGLAHEIRNPLTSIKMFIQILHGRLHDQADNQAMTAALLQEVGRLERIIDGIVERARPGAPVKTTGDINDPLREVLTLATPTLQASGITVESRLDDHLPAISYDPEKMKQVFWNLLLNGQEAMPKGGRLSITSAGAGHHIDITFTDSGDGLTGNDPESCFKPFYTTKPEGLGLGLSTSRRIVEQHGGALTLSSREEGGVIARIRLPAIPRSGRGDQRRQG